MLELAEHQERVAIVGHQEQAVYQAQAELVALVVLVEHRALVALAGLLV